MSEFYVERRQFAEIFYTYRWESPVDHKEYYFFWNSRSGELKRQLEPNKWESMPRSMWSTKRPSVERLVRKFIAGFEENQGELAYVHIKEAT